MNLPAVVTPQPKGLAINTGPTVLGERLARIPVGGRIRAGIKVLTATAAKVARAVQIYDAGVASGQKWGVIEKRLMEECKFERSPLTPRNVPYFSLFRSDFAMPEVADRIMELYAEDRGDGVKRLYRFPVIMPFDFWQANVPHSLRAFSRAGLKYWSEYDQQGVRHCLTHAPVEQGQKRVFGGRGTALRADNEGVCNPEKCREYQSGECKLSGELLCYLPGIPGASCVSVPSTSFYSMQGMRQQMEMVLSIRGRISGTEGGKPVFWLTKVQEEVSMIENGQPKRVKQWIVKLEANLDMSKLFAAHEPPALLAAGSAAAAALTGPADTEIEDEDPPAVTNEVIEHKDTSPTTGTDAPTDAGTSPDPSAGSAIKSVADLRTEIFANLDVMGIDRHDMAAYGEKTWGEGWGHDHAKLTKARQALEIAKDDKELLAKIKTARVPF